MSDRYERPLFDAIVEGRELEPVLAEHLTTCVTCQVAARRATAFTHELEAALARRRTEPMPADPMLAAPAVRPQRWLAAVAGAVVVLLAVVGVGIGGQILLPQPSPSASVAPSASDLPTASDSLAPSPSQPPDGIAAGTLAKVNGAAAILDVPGGNQWAVLEPDHDVLVIDSRVEGGTTWYRVEFEYCCSPEAPTDWVFGWVAADLETAGLSAPGWGIPPAPSGGPTLEPVNWSCPDPQQQFTIPEPVRSQCYGNDPITISGVLSGGLAGEGLYPGDPVWLTGLAQAALDVPAGSRQIPVHVPPDPLLLAWLNDERVKHGETVTVTGSYGPHAVACTKSPRIAGMPEMTAEEQQLWCDQQFIIGHIDAEGPDPILEAPDAEPLWTPPPGVQRESGDGWRLLASRTRNQLAVTVASETVEYALDEEAYRVLWFSVGHGEPPPVDFSREFVVRFVPPVSGSCPWIAFTGIGVNAEQDVLYGEYEYLSADLFLGSVSSNFGCTSDATPHAFLVAVDRSLAPASQFRLWLREERLCEGCGITWDERIVRLD